MLSHLREQLWNQPSCAWLPFNLSWSSFLSSWSCWTWTCSSSHLLLHCCSFCCNSCRQEHKNINPWSQERHDDVRYSTLSLMSTQIFHKMGCVPAGVSHYWVDTDVLLKVLQKRITSENSACLLTEYWVWITNMALKFKKPTKKTCFFLWKQNLSKFSFKSFPNCGCINI